MGFSITEKIVLFFAVSSIVVALLFLWLVDNPIFSIGAMLVIGICWTIFFWRYKTKNNKWA